MEKKIFKVMILGDSFVGKTSILKQYGNKTFLQKYKATIGSDFVDKELTIDEQKIKIEIWDTAGQEKYKSLTQNFYRGAEACMFVYDTTNKASLANLDSWVVAFFSQIHEKQIENFPVVIVGNKIDLKENDAPLGDAAKRWARAHNDPPLFEVSAKTGIGIKEAFNEIGRLLLKRESEGIKYSLGNTLGKKKY